MKGITTAEWSIKNYLNKHSIYKDDNDMQTVIINSFVNQCGMSNDEDWKTKLDYVHKNFGKFCMYAHNQWKNKKHEVSR